MMTTGTRFEWNGLEIDLGYQREEKSDSGPGGIVVEELEVLGVADGEEFEDWLHEESYEDRPKWWACLLHVDEARERLDTGWSQRNAYSNREAVRDQAIATLAREARNEIRDEFEDELTEAAVKSVESFVPDFDEDRDRE